MGKIPALLSGISGSRASRKLYVGKLPALLSGLMPKNLKRRFLSTTSLFANKNPLSAIIAGSNSLGRPTLVRLFPNRILSCSAAPRRIFTGAGAIRGRGWMGMSGARGRDGPGWAMMGLGPSGPGARDIPGLGMPGPGTSRIIPGPGASIHPGPEAIGGPGPSGPGPSRAPVRPNSVRGLRYASCFWKNRDIKANCARALLPFAAQSPRKSFKTFWQR